MVSGVWIQFIKYMEFNTLTQHTVYHVPMLNLPAITICNLNKIRRQNIADPRDKAILKNMYLKRNNISELLEFPGEEYMRNFSLRQMIVDGSMNTRETFLACAVAFEDDIKHCTPTSHFSGEDYCHTIYPSEDRDNDTFDDWFQDSFHGIYMLLWVNHVDYYISYGMAFGFKVLQYI